MKPFEGRTTDGFWWTRVVVLSPSEKPYRVLEQAVRSAKAQAVDQPRYSVECYERVFLRNENDHWEPRFSFSEEGFPVFDDLASANTEARIWLEQKEG